MIGGTRPSQTGPCEKKSALIPRSWCRPDERERNQKNRHRTFHREVVTDITLTRTGPREGAGAVGGGDGPPPTRSTASRHETRVARHPPALARAPIRAARVARRLPAGTQDRFVRCATSRAVATMTNIDTWL